MSLFVFMARWTSLTAKLVWVTCLMAEPLEELPVLVQVSWRDSHMGVLRDG